jgi:hypothetical protein
MGRYVDLTAVGLSLLLVALVEASSSFRQRAGERACNVSLSADYLRERSRGNPLPLAREKEH